MIRTGAPRDAPVIDRLEFFDDAASVGNQGGTRGELGELSVVGRKPLLRKSLDKRVQPREHGKANGSKQRDLLLRLLPNSEQLLDMLL